MQHLKPFLDWAKSVLDAADGGQPYIPTSVMKFETASTPVWTNQSGSLGIFSPGGFEPGDVGLVDIIASTVEAEMDAPKKEARLFAVNTLKLIRELEQYEHWVQKPLNYNELIGMSDSLHEVLFSLAQENNLEDDVERWSEERKVLADKVLLAVAYVLSWQSYGVTMQFIWGLAKPWYIRLSETIAEQLDNEEMESLWSALKCLRNRVLHFDSLLYGYLEGAGAFDPDEDVEVSQNDLDAIRMFTPGKKDS